MQVATRPMAAPASVLRWPTMAVSISCMATVENWAMMAG